MLIQINVTFLPVYQSLYSVSKPAKLLSRYPVQFLIQLWHTKMWLFYFTSAGSTETKDSLFPQKHCIPVIIHTTFLCLFLSSLIAIWSPIMIWPTCSTSIYISVCSSVWLQNWMWNSRYKCTLNLCNRRTVFWFY